MTGLAVAPERLGNEALRRQLGAIQDRVRTVMREFNIVSGHICAMARDAERSISDTALRAEFLRLLIDLHEFGRQAKSRGLLQAVPAAASGTPSHTVASPPGEAGLLRTIAGQPADAVCEDVSRAFFARLDLAGGGHGPMFPNRGKT